ncbi:2-dehydropantoate 2-reductase [Zobellia galactanivorans]|uniref:ketopantoate reductase family protein n=1 Tax=Zobellia galactanivorans (strain DSM 12802 / CCUG 47099 / CIP 106680 / NCIMB 13871 / Dsij) TaxID=63186 RepID=UPI001C06ABFD|nr:2-dehydropantoate 2-reductase [Zobellia galactanivorans]MBU3027419.1 2-dehydropantoate 2-reductase [Zobellia galactanivorans]MDO6809482.1 2-dehydropantoate 2-reductase [Zobellia galactanivorans]
MKIGILGMGGVGSFVGAKLTENYKDDPDTQIVFICRNKTKESIITNGLSLTTEGKTITCKPYLVSDDSKEIGLLDLLIVSTKSFSLGNAIGQYQDCLKKETIILPIQNGVDSKNVIENSIDHDNSKILEACIYIVSNIERPGVVKHLGGPGKIFFGNSDGQDYKWIEELLVKGGLNASYTKDIKTILWKKYLFVSPLAAMTAALDITLGELAENPAHMAKLEKMMKEVRELAKHFGITLSDMDINEALAMISNFPYQSKTSLQLDIESKNKYTEKANLVDYMITTGKTFGVKVDHYEEMSAKITV